MASDYEISHTYDLNVIRSAVNKVKRGAESGLNAGLLEKSQRLNGRFDREELLRWLDELDEGELGELNRAVDRQARRHYLEKRKSRWSYYDGLEYDASNDTTSQLESLILQIQTKEAAYYDSHFKFSNAGCLLYHVENIDGPLGKVIREADDAFQARDIFSQAVRDRDDIDDVYADAAEGQSPIVGDLVTAPRPRLIWFDDTEHIFIEFWSLGKEDTVFDGRDGFSFEYQERVRSAARIHLDEGKIELFDGKDKDTHRDAIVSRLEQLVNPPLESDEDVRSDGGKQQTAINNVMRNKSLSEDDIWDIMKEIGILVTMEGFGGRQADARLSAVQNRDVRRDEVHDEFDDRPIEITNIQMFVDDLNGRCEFIDPKEVDDRISFDEDAKREDMKEKVAEEFDYDNIDHVTVSLNTDNNLFRIQKERCTPNARRKLFDLATRGLSW